jgi:hypothetical protein
METAGYSKKPLVDKLGIKPGYRIEVINPPTDYVKLLGALPDDVALNEAASGALDFIHIFTTRREELEERFSRLKQRLAQTGMLWVSWPKGASKISTDLNENIIREIGLANGLVDVKVCAVDQNWSGLKFVYRLKDRKK